jgi:hypothetical protein
LTAALLLGTVGGAAKLSQSAPLIAFTTQPQNVESAEEAPIAVPAPHYQNVVYHPLSKAISPVSAGSTQVSRTRNAAAAVSPAKHLQPRMQRVSAQAHPPAELIGVPDGQVVSLVVVTRWEDASGQQTTVIHRFVRFATLSAAQAQAGWFVVQL